MPRSRLAIADQIEFLRILDAEGRVDETLDPRLNSHELLHLYRWMLFARRFDERMIMLSRQGRIGNYPPYRGQEAAAIGPAWVVARQDWLIPSFRELPALIHHGWPIHRIMLGWWGGHEIGAQPPQGVNALPLCGPVAGQCLHAAGIAMGLKRRGEGSVVVCFIGDGGTSEGDFHEALNVAGIFNLPLIMLVQNNHWAISTPRSRQTAAHTLAQKAIGYGIPAMMIDGNDLLASVVATREAVRRARSGQGPTVIEAVTYRLGPHSTSDDPRKYRDSAEVALWEKRDPLIRFEHYVRWLGVLDDLTRHALEDEIATEISAELSLAESYVANPEAPFFHCFEAMPPSLHAQLQEFRRHAPAPRPRTAATDREAVLPRTVPDMAGVLSRSAS